MLNTQRLILISPRRAPSLRSLCLVLFVLLSLVAAAAAAAGAAEAKRVDFFRDVQPIFKASCYGCHGTEQQMAGLRLDEKAAAFRGGTSGLSILPGKGKESLLVTMIEGTGKGLRMPPNAAPLPRETIEMIRLWIDQGAEWPEKPADPTHGHWAYRPVKRPPVPPVKSKAGVRNPVDAFVLARLEKEKLSPSPEAEKAVLLRRVSLDLIGLPPSVPELDAFLTDKSPNAYEKAVDRLLASPHFGERWARPWLDLARYADTNGYEKDDRRSLWPYRDWVIHALNQNLPFDRFTVEQIAGDMLPRPTMDQRIATGFHRNTMYNAEGGVDREEARWTTLVDRASTTATVWLGSTLACAQCHDHKYDPFRQKDFYTFLAFFERSLEPELKIPSPGQKAQQKNLETEIARLKERVENPALSKSDATAMKSRIAALEKRLRELPVPSTLVMEEKPGDEIPATALRIKGSFLQKGETVEAKTPEVLPALAADLPRNRLGLARWLVDSRNPLTARVAVNRFWETLFGVGIVETSEDFGTQGQRPSHPELLDWLASEFVAKNWDM
ncbi:MAG: PSD1 and planctomycete cytochrome C domain-containing protein, partial [Armatimonadetes bacterium]|nr:PSD1 and planctomycete cytochrome C domain-containing protein [Armatimonadota bacterium]